MIPVQEPKSSSEKREYWETQIQNWKASGLRQADFCRENGLRARQFMYWKKRLQEGESTPIRFVPVNAANSLESNTLHSIRLAVDRRFEISIGDDFSESTLERLIRTLGRL